MRALRVAPVIGENEADDEALVIVLGCWAGVGASGMQQLEQRRWP